MESNTKQYWDKILITAQGHQNSMYGKLIRVIKDKGVRQNTIV